MARDIYVVVLVDRGESWYQREQYTDHFKVSIHESCTQVHGLRFRASRPTTVINEIKRRDAKYDEWFAFCIKPMLTRAEYIDHCDYSTKEVQADGEQTQL